MTAPVLGVIADDFTGATDIAGLLARSGADVTLHIGAPDDQA
ncbi:MAG: four-carbon acid sugar kinase family protein, partial [Candidatus Puniceispirillaceae bacterium]